MKQLKFLKTVSCDGKPVWYKGCLYQVISEGANNQGREMYKLFCEDLKLRGIDKSLVNNFYQVIEIEDKKEVKGNIIITEKPENALDKAINEVKKEVNQQHNKSTQNNKKKKNNAKR